MNAITNYKLDTSNDLSSVEIKRYGIKRCNNSYHNLMVGVSSILLFGMNAQNTKMNNLINVDAFGSIENTVGFRQSSCFIEKQEIYTKYKKIKGRLKKEYTPDDASLAERFSKPESLDNNSIEVYTRDDYNSLINENSGRIISGLEKWL